MLHNILSLFDLSWIVGAHDPMSLKMCQEALCSLTRNNYYDYESHCQTCESARLGCIEERTLYQIKPSYCYPHLRIVVLSACF